MCVRALWWWGLTPDCLWNPLIILNHLTRSKEKVNWKKVSSTCEHNLECVCENARGPHYSMHDQFGSWLTNIIPRNKYIDVPCNSVATIWKLFQLRITLNSHADRPFSNQQKHRLKIYKVAPKWHFRFWYLIKVVPFFGWIFHTKRKLLLVAIVFRVVFFFQINEPQMERFPKRHSNLLNKNKSWHIFWKIWRMQMAKHNTNDITSTLQCVTISMVKKRIESEMAKIPTLWKSFLSWTVDDDEWGRWKTVRRPNWAHHFWVFTGEFGNEQSKYQNKNQHTKI